MSLDSQERRDSSNWLERRLIVTKIGRQRFSTGLATRQEVVVTSRLILVLSGRMNYTLENQTWQLPASTEFFIPAWSQRVWSVPVGDACEILWCEFDDGGAEFAPGRLSIRNLSLSQTRLEKSTLLRMLRQFQKDASRGALLEGELKAMLARFWEDAGAFCGRNTNHPPASGFHPRLKSALRELDGYFCEPDALERLYRQSGLSQNYFRRMFIHSLECSPRSFIERMRLCRARHLLHETPLSVKEVAAAVGFRDALYFSRIYRRFWNLPPSRERRPLNNGRL